MLAPTGLVSVIIPTTDKESEILKECISAINQSTYRNFEIIVVNEGLERSKQRNIGIQRAKGEYILILDSDQIITPYLLDECMDMARSGYNALYIPERIVTKGFFGYLRNWERQFYTGTCIDVVRFVKKDRCPLFDENMSGPEDSSWDRKVKGLKIVSNRYLYHKDNVTLTSYFKKKMYYTKSMKRFEEEYPNDLVLDFKYRCWTVFTENGKWKKFFSSPHLAFGVMLIILLRGIIYTCLKKY
jgi:glycosyltransferase involved in cell wall biosynthesis